MTLIETAFRNGIWQGRLEAAKPPVIEALHDGAPLSGLTVEPAGPGVWTVTLPLPASVLSAGVQVISFRDAGSGGLLYSLAIIAGEPAADDLRAEIALLRAEMELVKRVLRRQFRQE